MSLSSMASEAAENLETRETQKNLETDIEDLRKKCLALVESADPQNQFSSPQDIEENRRWLNSTSAFDPKKMAAFADQYPKSVKYDKDLIEKYDAKIKGRIDAGLLARSSEKEYKEWFRDQPASKKSEFLKKCDLDDPARVKTKAEFDELNKKFPDVRLRAKFLESDLEGRQRIVSDLKEKKKIIEGIVILPSIVRSALFHSCANVDVATCKKTAAETQKKHAELKKRFISLPPLVQEENRENFKEMLLDEREKWLAGIEIKIRQLTASFKDKIRQKQQPDATGLNLFSNISEKTPGSSSNTYTDWFQNKLTINGMKASLQHSDLDDPKRETRRKEMSEILPMLGASDRERAKQEFNSSDLEKREQITAKYRNSKNSTDGEKRGFFQGILHRVLRSESSKTLKQKIETYSIVREITKRRRRFRLLHHATSNNTMGKAAADESTHVLKSSAEFEKATELGKMRKDNGKVQVKLETLELNQDARTQWRRFLKPDIDNKEAQLAADISLKTRAGNEVNDEEIYRRTELAAELAQVKSTAMPLINEAVRNSGIVMSSPQLKQELDSADWEANAKSVLKKAA